MRATIFATAMAIAGSSTHAKSPFDGHWVEDLQTQAGDAGFDKYVVAHGIYKCESCYPPRTYPADGKMRPVPGDASVISEGVTIAGPRTIVTRIVDHEMARETTMTVARDGRTATYVSLDQWPGRLNRLRTVYVAERTSPAPAGADAVSGSWRGLRYVEVPEEYRSADLKEANGQFTRSNFRHGHYKAKIGGNAASVTGDGKDIYKAVVRAPDAYTRTETILLNGKALVERTYRLSADGESMTTTARDPQDGSAYVATSRRK
jgi:hypothetical protein